VAVGLGAVVVGYGALLDRGGGGKLPGGLRSLARLDSPTYEPATCPLCAAGGVAEKPGSRPAAAGDWGSWREPPS
jgi:orotate phosphoribosyltransferase